jgi:hypothetical protein
MTHISSHAIYCLTLKSIVACIALDEWYPVATSDAPRLHDQRDQQVKPTWLDTLKENQWGVDPAMLDLVTAVEALREFDASCVSEDSLISEGRKDVEAYIKKCDELLEKRYRDLPLVSAAKHIEEAKKFALGISDSKTQKRGRRNYGSPLGVVLEKLELIFENAGGRQASVPGTNGKTSNFCSFAMLLLQDSKCKRPNNPKALTEWWKNNKRDGSR